MDELESQIARVIHELVDLRDLARAKMDEHVRMSTPRVIALANIINVAKLDVDGYKSLSESWREVN